MDASRNVRNRPQHDDRRDGKLSTGRLPPIVPNARAIRKNRSTTKNTILAIPTAAVATAALQ
jgi:hypothetical protein